MQVPEAIARQALHPFRELPMPPGWERVTVGPTLACFHPLPIAQMVEPVDLAAENVQAAVDEVRAAARSRGKSLVVWWIAPEDDALAEPLERAGLVNEDTPGFEAVENAMALTAPPAGSDRPDGVVVTQVASIEDFAAADHAIAEAFEMPQEMREQAAASRTERYRDFAASGDEVHMFIASIDGRVVGAANAIAGSAGVNLYGGSVVADARGRGVYRALIRARWELAVARGTPALTVQAGRMSKPIAERLGFQLVAPARIYVDKL